MKIGIIGLDPRIGNMFLNAGPRYGESYIQKYAKQLLIFIKTRYKTKLDAIEQVNHNQVKNIQF